VAYAVAIRLHEAMNAHHLQAFSSSCQVREGGVEPPGLVLRPTRGWRHSPAGGPEGRRGGSRRWYPWVEDSYADGREVSLRPPSFPPSAGHRRADTRPCDGHIGRAQASSYGVPGWTRWPRRRGDRADRIERRCTRRRRLPLLARARTGGGPGPGTARPRLNRPRRWLEEPFPDELRPTAARSPGGAPCLR